MENWLTRTELLIGKEGIKKLQNAKDFNEHDTIYFSINENTAQWQNLSHSFTDPTAI